MDNPTSKENANKNKITFPSPPSKSVTLLNIPSVDAKPYIIHLTNKQNISVLVEATVKTYV